MARAAAARDAYHHGRDPHLHRHQHRCGDPPAFIGGGGLGDPIVTGLQLDNINMVLSGAIPAALLALLVDGALGRLERRLVPRGLD